MPVAATAIYTLEAWIAYINPDEAADLKIGFTFPAAAILSCSGAGLFTNVTGATAGIVETVARLQQTSPSTATSYGAVAGNTGLLLRGLLRTGGAAGTLQLQFAQSVSSGTGTTIKQDSWMALTRRS